VSLPPGTRLGRYEVLTPLGAGGMGEVYRARDTRLERDVAIKILPASLAHDADRLARFEREAKAVAALSHPNILALHDAGTEGGTTFAVTELLEGESLRERLVQGPIPVRRAVDVATQVARGLSAAHAKGLVHRDLKPENVFLVGDGQVKILDFGLAKTSDASSGADATATNMAMTDPGTVLGTVGYMAPEQVRGHAIDARTDLFALGAVLYEMITGQRAFRRDTAAETMTAILREEPPDLPAPQLAQAPVLDRIIRHCLEKNPAERFQSARDVAFALESMSGTTGTTGTVGTTGAAAPSRVSSRAVAAATFLVIAAGAVAWLSGYLHVGRATSTGAAISDIRYQPVTFDEGFVFAARFARDGRTVVYSADWETQARDVFVTSIDNVGARALGYKGADLLAVAPDGAIAILMNGTIPAGNPYGRSGTVARASLTGGAPRGELDQVQFADFAPDGTIAVSRRPKDSTAATIEWPQGNVLVRHDIGNSFTALPNPRISPDGRHLAYFRCIGTGCGVRVVDKSGKPVADSKTTYADWWGLAWSADSQHVWFAVAETGGRQCTLFTVDLTGRERLLLRVPGAMTVHDLSADGRLLAAFDQVVGRIELRESPTAVARDLSWKEGGYLRDVADNGTILFEEAGDSGGPLGSAYVRRPSEPEPVRISDGMALAISNDGGRALVWKGSPKAGEGRLRIVPTTGLAQDLDIGPVDSVTAGGFLNDGRIIIELLRQADQPPATFVRPAAGGALAPFLPEGMHLSGPRVVAPDGMHVFAADADRRPAICTVPASGLAVCTALAGVTSDDRIAGWTADSRAVLVYQKYPVPIRIDRVEIATGKRSVVTTVRPATAAVSGVNNLVMTPSGSIVYGYARNRSTLYVISGVR
jgi:hypothetical protein